MHVAGTDVPHRAIADLGARSTGQPVMIACAAARRRYVAPFYAATLVTQARFSPCGWKADVHTSARRKVVSAVHAV